MDSANPSMVSLLFPALGPFLAYSAVVLLTAVLPFVLSYTAHAGALMLRRGRAALPAVLTAAVVALIVAASGFLLLQLGLSLGAGPLAASGRLLQVAGGLLLVCVPLAVCALVMRMVIAALRAKAQERRDDEARRPAAEPDQLARMLDYAP